MSRQKAISYLLPWLNDKIIGSRILHVKKLQTVDLLTPREKAAKAQGILFQQAFCKSQLFQVIIFCRCHLLNASP